MYKSVPARTRLRPKAILRPRHPRTDALQLGRASPPLAGAAADIRAQGGVAHMPDLSLIRDTKHVVTIPVMAKARIGHFVEAVRHGACMGDPRARELRPPEPPLEPLEFLPLLERHRRRRPPRRAEGPAALVGPIAEDAACEQTKRDQIFTRISPLNTSRSQPCDELSINWIGSSMYMETKIKK